jgi:hypothetical protein
MRRVNLNYIIDMALFVQFLLVGGSGLIMYFNHQAGGHLLRFVHDQIGILMLVFFVAHIILNWSWIVSTTIKLCKREKELEEKENNDKHYVPMN